MFLFCEAIEQKNKVPYEEPKIDAMSVTADDIITASHSDPNMGEWDTE